MQYFVFSAAKCYFSHYLWLPELYSVPTIRVWFIKQHLHDCGKLLFFVKELHGPWCKCYCTLQLPEFYSVLTIRMWFKQHSHDCGKLLFFAWCECYCTLLWLPEFYSVPMIRIIDGLQQKAVPTSRTASQFRVLLNFSSNKSERSYCTMETRQSNSEKSWWELWHMQHLVELSTLDECILHAGYAILLTE